MSGDVLLSKNIEKLKEKIHTFVSKTFKFEYPKELYEVANFGKLRLWKVERKIKIPLCETKCNIRQSSECF